MAKDPGFIFYPGDYLRDTQVLSEKSQVAYDRIMCEHMRNICISKKQLKFLTKKLNTDEIEELMMVLTEKNGGFSIEWVVDSITKRRAYSESRRKNRSRENKEIENNISITYDEHMDNENEIENESISDNEKKIIKNIMSYFGFTEMNHYTKMVEIGKFITILTNNKKLDYFITQFKAYKLYKEKSKTMRHGFKNFLGTIEEKYNDGGWCAENWEEKLKQEIKPQKNKLHDSDFN